MMKKSKSTRISIRILITAAVLLPLFVLAQPGLAALGWVGNMWPAGESVTNLTSGSSFTVYVQVYKDGVTDEVGPGADITCTLHWGAVPYFGGDWINTTDTSMSYNTDVGNNDEYAATIVFDPHCRFAKCLFAIGSRVDRIAFDIWRLIGCMANGFISSINRAIATCGCELEAVL